MEFSYRWNLQDLKKVKNNGLNVFSCFSCAGGSTMGYKMSGFNVIGCCEIDPQMIDTYIKNHNPKYPFLESIETFKSRKNLPKELFELDILDGSPPCSSFSMVGSREKKWGEKKKFREGQAEQVLDDLFFHYIDLAKRLKPKVVVAENVKGMITGKAKGYTKEVIKKFQDAGYEVQLFLLNAATMGVPQARERVFFICRKKELNWQDLNLEFKDEPIPLKIAFENLSEKGKDRSSSKNFNYWLKCKPGELFSSVHPKGSFFNCIKLSPDKPSCTITSRWHNFYHWESMRYLSLQELCCISSFPFDYKFKSDNLAGYQMGMSVPPLMMHKISREIHRQWFKEKESV